MECDELETYLTEYSRSQLSKLETNEIEKHLESCIRCRRTYEEINDLTVKIDKLIPTVSRTYEKDFIYRLFINSKPESLLVKGVSIILITSLFVYMISWFFQPKTDYTSIGSLENRAKNIFKEDFYSHGQNK